MPSLGWREGDAAACEYLIVSLKQTPLLSDSLRCIDSLREEAVVCRQKCIHVGGGLMFVPALLFLAALAQVAVVSPREVRDQDFALLSLNDAMLSNNVWGKGNIVDAKQAIFREGVEGGWTWDWPRSAGPGAKTYPEIILGRSPWQPVRAGSQLPCSIGNARLTLDFDFSSEGTGSWCDSFDFWITGRVDSTSKDITCNLTIWTMKHGLEPSYKGRHETLRIGGRTYEAIFETPADRPGKAWTTLCLQDTEPRSSGRLELGPLVDLLIARGLAQPTHFLATAELGSEIAFGTGRTTIRKFILR